MICYPEDKLKDVWECIVSFTLLVMCMTTPIYIAFHDSDNTYFNTWNMVNLIQDFIFGIDIIIHFMTSYYNEDFKLIDDRKIIANKYLSGWFVPDTLAIFPFEYIIQQDNKTERINGMIRISKFSRLYKLIKLTRLLRMLKFLK